MINKAITLDSDLNSNNIYFIENVIKSDLILNFGYLKIYPDSSIHVIMSSPEINVMELIESNLITQLKMKKNVQYFTSTSYSILMLTKRCDTLHLVSLFFLSHQIYVNLLENEKLNLLGILLSTSRIMHVKFRFDNKISPLNNKINLWHPLMPKSKLISKYNLSQSEISFLTGFASSGTSKELSMMTGYSYNYLNKISSIISKKLNCTTKFELQELARIIVLSQYLEDL
jgi:hypothetical protein